MVAEKLIGEFMFRLSQSYFYALTIVLLFSFQQHSFAYSDGDVTEMSLVASSNDVSLKFSNSIDKTRNSTIELTWWQVFSESIQAKVSLAYVELSQNSNSTVLAYDASGYKLGVGFRGNAFNSEFLTVGLNVSFDYLSADGNNTQQETVQVTWFEYSGGVDLEFLPNNSVSILTGASYTVIDGEHKTVDVANSAVTYSEDTPEGYYAGVSFKSGQRGRINMTWHGGHSQGIYLSFSNHF